MNIENIDEAQDLIEKYRIVMDLKRKIAELQKMDDITASEHFLGGIEAEASEILLGGGERLDFEWMWTEVFERLNELLNEKYDKITTRLREL